MNHHRLSVFLLFGPCLLTVACTAPSAPPADQPPTAAATHDSAIHWFEGSVDDAFALAARENRPVFLYWGAVWCPPCHYLKSKIFTRPEVTARLATFVPVYLDGDTERAQTLGERYATKGYPTVIVFAPDGREVTRLDSMLPAEHYVAALDSALAAARPIAEVVAEVSRLGAAASRPEDLRLLAFQSWGQAPEPEEDRAALFERLWRETPATMAVEKARFLSLAVQALADRHDDSGSATTIDDARRGELRAAISELLATAPLRAATLDLLLYGATKTIDLLAPVGDPERAALAEAWSAALGEVEEDDEAAVDDRLTALGTQVELAELDGAELSDELRERVRQRVAWAADAVDDEGELQTVLSTMAGVLSAAGLADEAEALLRDKLDQTAAPWYFTSFLASLRHRAGADDEAVALYREAWQSARGSASRFRWGSIYLRRAMELAGDDEQRIRSDLDAALGELLAEPDAFAGGNWTRLEQLGGAAVDWAGEHPQRRDVVDGLRQRVHERCAAQLEEAARARCVGFLEA